MGERRPPQRALRQPGPANSAELGHGVIRSDRQHPERSKREIREKIQWVLKFADISTKADDFVESAPRNPAFEESAMFENMAEMMLKREYDMYVFDTAPTANARRLLGMSKVYAL